MYITNSSFLLLLLALGFMMGVLILLAPAAQARNLDSLSLSFRV